MKYAGLDNVFNESQKIYIANGKFSLMQNDGDKKHVFDIRYFNRDMNNNKIFFMKESINEEGSVKYLPNELNILSEFELRGMEMKNLVIQYTRVTKQHLEK